MNDVEKARSRLLIALFVDSHRPERRYLSREQLQAEYSLNLDTPIFNGLTKELRDAGLLKTYPDRATYLVRLRTDAHAAALGGILQALHAESFSVNWQGQRIGTDADDELSRELLMTIPEGWLLMTYAKDKPSPPSAPSVAPMTHQISAAGDVIMVNGDVHRTSIGRRGSSGTDGWTRWGTIFGGLGVLAALATIGMSLYL